MKKKLIVTAVIAVLLAAFLWSPFSNYPISLAVMKVYSGIHERKSLMAKKGIELTIPGGSVTAEKDWYPFVMTFNDSQGFQRFTGRDDLELTILYNFPAFDLLKGCSRLYDITSPYYNGFYGAYLISSDGVSSDEATPYGFLDDGTMDLAATAQVPRFDFQNLVLRDFGIDQSQMVFQWQVTDTQENVDYAGIGGWTRVDALLTVNGVLHEKEGFHQSYLQYGAPAYRLAAKGSSGAEEADEEETAEEGTSNHLDVAEEAFAPVDMVGRIYGRYFPEWSTSVFFYVLASDEEVLENCDRDILSKSVIGENPS